MKTTVTREIEIPDGYELAEPMMRKAVYGEIILANTGNTEVWPCSISSFEEYPILRKTWQPTVGKWYMFSDFHGNVGSCLCPIGRLTEYNPAWEQPYRALGSRYNYCWPVPNEVELGE